MKIETLMIERISDIELTSRLQRWRRLIGPMDPKHAVAWVDRALSASSPAADADTNADTDDDISAAAILDTRPLGYQLRGLAVFLAPSNRTGRAGEQQAAKLISEAVREARKRRLQALYAWDLVRCESDDWRWWHSLGFEPRPQLMHYEVELDAYLAMLSPLYDRLTVHGRDPDNAVIKRLSEVPVARVIQLQIDEIGGDAGRLDIRLRGRGTSPFDLDMSHVALQQDEVCGFLLARVDRRNRLCVESRVVASGQRRGWVNVALMEESAQAARRRGYTQVRFLANERQPDTHRLALKAGPSMRRMDVMAKVIE